MSKFTHADLTSIRDKAIKLVTFGSARCRLEGMARDLTAHEQVSLAYFEASVEVMNRLGVLDRTKLDGVMPTPFQADHDVIDEEVCRGSKK